MAITAGVGPDDYHLALRVIPMPRDTNAYGTVFGGVILSFIDQAGFVEVQRHGRHRWVTASIERVDFRAPVHVGDIVTLYTRTLRAGRSSVSVGVVVEAERRFNRSPGLGPVRVTEASITMVSVDEQGRAIPFLTPATI